AEQGDRTASVDQREDGEGAPDERLPPDRRHGPHPGGALGPAARLDLTARCGPRTEVRLRRRRRGGHDPAMRVRPFLALLAVAVALVTPSRASADGGADRIEVRIRGACTGPSAAELRIRSEKGTMRIEFRI